MSYLDENPHEVKNAAYYRRQLAEYKQRAEAAEAKLRELEVIEAMFDDALQQDDCFWLRELASKAQMQLSMLCAKPFPAPKQEEK